VEHGWTAVCASAELRTLPRRAVVDGVEVVVWRLPDGGVAALDDRCAHQWVRLSLGTVLPDGCLVCPSHGWTFLPSGANAFGGEGVPAHHTREEGGHVLVRLRRAQS
jgi:phenylpropionate dioxygenase-like ring-hydroxylating dioxygenase large terminal subunit